MYLIKLDAIDSTNEFLKKMARSQKVNNFTVVVANQQTKGKGQMGTNWASQSGKNLTFSVLIQDFVTNDATIFDLNVACSMAILSVLKRFEISTLTLKWPNDIMSDKHKIGGILIENVYKADGTTATIVGVGLNVNQTDFIDLPNASSLALKSNKEFNLELILDDLITEMKLNVEAIANSNKETLWNSYQNALFKRNKVMTFEDQSLNRFSGIIKRVDNSGKIEIELESGDFKLFNLKELKMLY